MLELTAGGQLSVRLLYDTMTGVNIALTVGYSEVIEVTLFSTVISMTEWQGRWTGGQNELSQRYRLLAVRSC